MMRPIEVSKRAVLNARRPPWTSFLLELDAERPSSTVGLGLGHADLDLGLHVDLGAAVIGAQRVVEAREHVVLARQTVADLVR